MAAKRVRSSSSSTPSNWAGLPRDLIDSILNKLLHLSDHVRFGAVCKSWNSAAKNHYKEKRALLCNHQLPWLLASPAGPDYQIKRRLCSITTKEICNFEFQMPSSIYSPTCSCGCLTFIDTRTRTIMVFNPLSGARFFLPPLKVGFDMPAGVRFSRDPFLGSFEVITLASDGYAASDGFAVAYLNSSDQFWTYSKKRVRPQDNFIEFTFYKDGILGLTDWGKIRSMHVNSGVGIKFRKIELTSRLPSGDNVDHHFVETTSGDLVMVHRFHDRDDELKFKKYKVNKLVYAGEDSYQKGGRFEVIPMNSLDGDSFFLCGDSSEGISVLASNYPGCKPNSIYYPDCHNIRRMKVVNIEDGSVESFFITKDKAYRKALSPFWIVPSMKL